MTNRMIAIAAGLGLLAVAGCSAGAGASTGAQSATTSGAGGSGQQVATITATGTGTVSGTPDTLTLQLSVQTQASSANAALAANNQKANAVIATLKSKGVPSRDLQTTGLSIQPNYSQDGNTITGYQVSDDVQATLHDLSKAGSVIDAAAAAGSNAIRVDGITLSIADDSSLRTAARVAAVKQAQAQAAQMAQAAGVQLGKIASITDIVTQTPQPVNFAPAAGTAAPSVPIQAGSQQESVQVQVVYDISQ